MTLPQPMPFFSAAAKLVAGNDTPREFLERCLSHVEAFEPAVGAFVCHDIAAARAAADRSAARWRARLRRDGLPIRDAGLQGQKLRFGHGAVELQTPSRAAPAATSTVASPDPRNQSAASARSRVAGDKCTGGAAPGQNPVPGHCEPRYLTRSK